VRDDAEGILRATVLDMQSDQTSGQQAEKSGAQAAVGRGWRPHAGVVIPWKWAGGVRFDLWAVIAEYRAFGRACSGCGAKVVRLQTCATWMT